MNNTEYHAKIVRLPVGKEVQTRREVMRDVDTKELLTGHVYVTEKLDGRLTWVPGGLGPSSKALDYDFFYEDLRIRHSVYYDQLPNWYVFLDVTEGHHVLAPAERGEVPGWNDAPEFLAPVIDEQAVMTPDYFLDHLQDYLQRKPAFASSGLIEGIVVKNYDKQLFGKVVSFEFYRGIEESGSYLRRRVQEGNRLLVPVLNRRE